MASSSNSISESSFLDVNIKNYVPINLTYCSSTYVDWKSQIIHVLKSFKLDGHVTGKSVCPSPCLSDYSFWVRKEATVIFWLYATLSPDVHKHIHGIDILQNIFGIDFPTERQTCTLSARQIWLAIELLFRHQPIEYPAPDSDTQSMADWSQLPKDLLSSIAQRLEICFDSTHFRSVCTSWRSSAPPKPCLLPAKFPLNGYDFKRVKSFDLYKCIIVLIRFPKQPDQWLQDHRLVMIMEDKAKGMHLMNPLSNSRINCSSLYYRINCSSLLDFMNCQVIELSRQYVVHYEPGYRGYIGKVACMCSSTEENYHVLLVDHLHKKLAMLSSRDKRWTALENMSKSWEDIISFNGKFYAIDKLGRTTVVEPSLNVSSLATVGFGTRRQFLIESGSELLLVQMFLSANHFGMNMGDKQKCFPSSLGRLRFKVYKLNEARQKWELVDCLGDAVLFLGIYGAFSASASKFVWSSRNSIYFSLNSICAGLPIINSHQISIEDMFVFNYKNGRVDPLHNCPGFTKLFSPPPDWVTSTTK